MKIVIPAVASRVIGTRTVYEDDIVYNDPSRPCVWGECRDEDIVEQYMTTKVVFDRDLRVVARLKATAALAAFSAVTIVVVPVAVAGALVCEGLERIADAVRPPLYRFRAFVTKLVPALQYTYGFRATFKTMLREIVA